ncbi:MAG: hypothetical protein CR991_00050 [Proteobacteria bacterium]|nr:MAG: hypothetical protein CR991_00050 [Pseudomonadota bacterium]
MTPRHRTTAKDPLRRINLDELMNGGKKIILQHGQRPYFLTITRRGKLILTAAEEQQRQQPAGAGSTASVQMM